jgi:hypothetical protein
MDGLEEYSQITELVFTHLLALNMVIQLLKDMDQLKVAGWHLLVF